MAAAVGPATPAATPAARCSQARALWQYAFAALVCTPLYGVSVARAHGTLRRLYLTSRPRWPCRPALHGRGGEKRPIAAILDAAALWRRRCSQNCEAIVETLLDEDAAPTRFADRSFLGCRLLFPVYHWSQLRHIVAPAAQDGHLPVRAFATLLASSALFLSSVALRA